ncbi:hypothetical protein SBOR_8773 [Sclerotinia borealis F-4128]|uniref:RRM domain-containing protein n=1 Tax=Sclerotinia borealis (strain F-4128) TaxID=1432307 RepID=W9C559_SCLBF|nr:hypothetical protein SBOR_8773 [Sclerotinia borealis F-4128]
MSSAPQMNAFHGEDPTSLAFQKELLQLAPFYTLKDLHSDDHSSANTLLRETSTAHQQDGAFEGKDVEDTRDQSTMRSFLDLSLTQSTLHGTRESFKITDVKWRSMYPMVHPRFGNFKFVYSLPFGFIDYESCFWGQGNTNIMSSIVNYPRQRSSWLHVLPKVSTRGESESEIIENSDGQIIQSSTNYSTDRASSALPDSTIITQPEISDSPKKTVYIPPHKRGGFDAAHSRAQSESSVPATKNAMSGRDKKKHQSLDVTPWQTNPNVARRTFTSSVYTLHSGLPTLPGSLPAAATGSTTQTLQGKKLSDQSKYKGTGLGTKAIKDLADNLNCSVFVTHLPEEIKHHEIFAVINTGSVISLHIMGPVVGCPFSAAKIVFKYPEGAARFIAKVNNSPDGIAIRDHHFCVVYNDHGMVKHTPEHQSRVIHIEGPYNKMTEEFWRT